MTRGVVLFAFNSPTFNYYNMAEFTAKRVNYFLNLPVTLITDQKSIPEQSTYKFDNIIFVDSDSNNKLFGNVWINKGRYRAYELSPYDETLLLDVDYVVNSNLLLKTFDLMDDFICHESVNYLMNVYGVKENLSEYSFPSLWATAVAFKKTKRVKQIFDCLKMVQENYQHYSDIHKFDSETFRNDYGLTLAWRIVNGHTYVKSDIIPWNLMHIGLKTAIYKNSKDFYDTEYTVIFDRWKQGKLKKEYIVVKDCDFHVINKELLGDIL